MSGEAPHQHGHHGHDYVGENQKYFDEVAGVYQSPDKSMLHVTEHSVASILEQVKAAGLEWDAAKTRVLDYACGGGLVSERLAPHAKEIVGMDVSPKMIEIYNEKAQEQGLHMHAVAADLCSASPSVDLSLPEYNNFDVVVSTLAFHHFENVELATKRLAERLKPGSGVLVIVDFRSHHNPNEENANWQKVVAHNGFSDERMSEIFYSAGLVDFASAPVGPDGGSMTLIGLHRGSDGQFPKIVRDVFASRGRRA